ncbi:hypothetical protein [Paenibacillus odorifer]|uniref:hypothetical protein n=1 Tax=Paenibacillus odorifer TaxID=189426 RepID=UPI00096D265B|nr:hypothetical protein [Paenibacillus odorifer]OMD67459.1 hypothetical protein BSK50_30245 [Paenibacillus odorifer]
MAVKKQNVKEATPKLKCNMCEKEYSVITGNYYNHKNKFVSSERFPLCKGCIDKYIGDKESAGHKERVIEILKELNQPFLPDLWENSKCNFNKSTSNYIRNIGLPQYKEMTFSDSVIERKSVSNDEEYEEGYSEKWRGTYPAEDIEFLNNYLSGLMKDFKIINTSHMDYARKICKASLHMDKCFDEMSSAVSGADKRYESAKKIFDDLSKSANFAESSRNKDLSVGSLSKIVDQVENGTYVYKHVPEDQDLYDRLLINKIHVEKSL